MQKQLQLLAQVLELADGKLVGRVRIQKIFYLLDQLGLSSKLRYEYHHYGPYADDLSSVLIGALLTDVVKEEAGYRVSDGVRYSVFKIGEKADLKPSKKVGDLPFDEAKRLMGILKNKDATVLELAATAHWLKKYEQINDWKYEIKIRKGSKVEKGRLEKAENLLKEIGLSV